MGAIANIGVSVTARVSKFLKGMKRARKALRRFGTAISGAGRMLKKMAFGISGLAAAGAVGFGKLLFAGERFNRKMNQSQAIMTGLTKTVRDDMKKAAFAAARATVFSAEDMAQAYFFLASAGLDAEQSIAALPKVAQFAQAGMFDLSLATDLLTDAQSALGLSSDDAQKNMANMARISDVLVGANTLANASVEQFSQALTNKVGAASAVAGISLENTVAVLLAFADKGRKAQDAGTGMAIALRELSKRSRLNAKAFEEANIRVDDGTGHWRELGLIIQDVENFLEPLPPLLRDAALENLGFQQKSIDFIKVLLGSGKKISEWSEQLKDLEGVTKRVADKQLTPLQEATAKLTAAWTELGVVLTPVMTALAHGLKGVAKELQAFVNSLTQDMVVDWLRGTLNTIDLMFRDLKIRFLETIGVINDQLLLLAFSIQGSSLGKKLGFTADQVKPFIDIRSNLGAALVDLRADFNRLKTGGTTMRGDKLVGDEIADSIQARLEKLETQAIHERAVEFDRAHPFNRQEVKDPDAVKELIEINRSLKNLTNNPSPAVAV